MPIMKWLTFTAHISEPQPLAINGLITPVTCHNLNTGAIDITVTGGTKKADYAYYWTTLDGSGVTPLNQDQTGLTDGTYSVTVKDDNLCTKSSDFVVTEPLKLTLPAVPLQTSHSPRVTTGPLTCILQGAIRLIQQIGQAHQGLLLPLKIFPDLPKADSTALPLRIAKAVCPIPAWL